jgi:hypothetical protein
MINLVKEACLSFKTQFYTLSQIAELTTSIERKELRHKIWKLAAAGYITIVKSYDMTCNRRGRPNKEYWLRNTRKLIPALLPDRTNGQTGWDKMWKAVRALRRFTRDDLARICNQTPANVAFFTKRYRKLGYMRPSKESGRGVVWMLIKDPGPARPLSGKHSTHA